MGESDERRHDWLWGCQGDISVIGTSVESLVLRERDTRTKEDPSETQQKVGLTVTRGKDS